MASKFATLAALGVAAFAVSAAVVDNRRGTPMVYYGPKKIQSHHKPKPKTDPEIDANMISPANHQIYRTSTATGFPEAAWTLMYPSLSRWWFGLQFTVFVFAIVEQKGFQRHNLQFLYWGLSAVFFILVTVFASFACDEYFNKARDGVDIPDLGGEGEHEKVVMRRIGVSELGYIFASLTVVLWIKSLSPMFAGDEESPGHKGKILAGTLSFATVALAFFICGGTIGNELSEVLMDNWILLGQMFVYIAFWLAVFLYVVHETDIMHGKYEAAHHLGWLLVFGSYITSVVFISLGIGRSGPNGDGSCSLPDGMSGGDIGKSITKVCQGTHLMWIGVCVQSGAFMCFSAMATWFFMWEKHSLADSRAGTYTWILVALLTFTAAWLSCAAFIMSFVPETFVTDKNFLFNANVNINIANSGFNVTSPFQISDDHVMFMKNGFE